MGKLIVFEGADGAGKATQSNLLYERLARAGVDCRKLDFPRYGEPSAAALELYLHGALGEKPEDVNCYAASTLFAVDRFCSYRQDWGAYYEAGGILIADRYTTSNAVHQASKLPQNERRAFLEWLFDFEYRLLGLPEPTRVIYLNVPDAISERLLRQREAQTNTSADIHEKDAAYLRACHEAGAMIAEEYGWLRIDCAKDGAMRSVQDIHETVWQGLLPALDI